MASKLNVHEADEFVYRTDKEIAKFLCKIFDLALCPMRNIFHNQIAYFVQF